MDVKNTVQALPASTGVYTKGHKRVKLWHREETDRKNTQNVIDYSDPFAINHMLDKIDGRKYGSATKEIEALITRDMQFRGRLIALFPSLGKLLNSTESNSRKELSEPMSKLATKPACVSGVNNVIDLDDDDDNDDKRVVTDAPIAKADQPVVIVDSDEEDQKEKVWKPSNLFQEIVLSTEAGKLLLTNTEHKDDKLTQSIGVAHEVKDRGVYIGVEDEEDDLSNVQDDGLGDIWNEMNFSLECSKDAEEDHSWDDFLQEDEEFEEEEESCVHSFVLKDDLGYVCRICGVINKSIETIVEIQYSKAKRSTRTYASDTRHNRDHDSSGLDGVRINQVNFAATEIAAHPRHWKQMKPHQVEGFNFLVNNLVSDNPGGCILAHAPGSGKTFMIISFMQSFLAKYPNAKPLVVLPKGILPTWKKEFQIWQVEDIPLLDFYTRKADNRSQQLEVLKQWYDQKSILFLGYKQFSTIICDGTSEIARSCQNLLLQGPSILILDEGHTPRNEDTDVLQSLAKVQTPRKVVLSGTLYQNHVKEVFNILNLVRPKFLKMETSRLAIKRIMSRVHISGARKLTKSGGDAAFYDLVEETLQKDTDFKRKVNVIQDLREMTSKVLHYYKGDFLDELPGLVDYTVLLNLTPKQRHEINKIKLSSKAIKLSSVISSLTLHPKLDERMVISSTTNAMMDELLEKEDFRQGVKAKFIFNLLNLCDYAGEKLLVFSQYLIPLKFLERLVTKVKGWALDREIFVISGDTSSEQREFSMDRFNNSPDAKVFFGSIRACGEGISLVGASRIIILDVHLNPSVTRQAIGRAFRPGQKKKVFAYRLVASDSPEEEFHNTCFRKELISKLWFEWNEYCGTRAFEVETLDVNDCGDSFFESPKLREDVKALYKR